jgi:ribosomal protein L11 methyltransferase
VAPVGVTVEPAFEAVEEGLAGRLDPSRPAVVRAYLAAGDPGSRAAAERAADDARTALGHLQAFGLRPIGELTVRMVQGEAGRDAWKRYFPVLRVGRRLVIRPTWRRHRPTGDEVVVALDPGMAFGTGLHPTTRLCLVGLEAWADGGLLEGQRLLDVGCGSGILSLAAVRLGARSALGVDPDPLAVTATRANARRDGLARRVRAVEGSLPAPGSPYPLVVANLIAGLLIRLAPDLGATVRPSARGRDGGRLLAGGIFHEREAEVRAALEGAGLTLVGRWEEGEWVALELQRR